VEGEGNLGGVPQAAACCDEAFLESPCDMTGPEREHCGTAGCKPGGGGNPGGGRNTIVDGVGSPGGAPTSSLDAFHVGGADNGCVSGTDAGQFGAGGGEVRNGVCMLT